MKKILLIATGGTIASKSTDSGLAPQLNSGEILEFIPNINQMCHVDTIQLFNLDSTNIQQKHWEAMAKVVQESYQTAMTGL